MSVLAYIAIPIIVVFASARMTRMLTFDDFPPAKFIRDHWDARTLDSGWNELFHCPYCMGIWVSLPFTVLGVAILFGWGAFTTLTGAFLAFCAWMTVGYLNGIIVGSNWG